MDEISDAAYEFLEVDMDKRNRKKRCTRAKKRKG